MESPILHSNQLTAGDAGGLAGGDDDLPLANLARKVRAARAIQLGEYIIKEEYRFFAAHGGANLTLCQFK